MSGNADVPCRCGMKAPGHTREFHAKGGRIGSREGKARGGRISNLMLSAESRRLGARNQPVEAKRLGSVRQSLDDKKRGSANQPIAAKRLGGYRCMEMHGSPATDAGRSRGGTVGGPRGGLVTARIVMRTRPRVPEAVVWLYLTEGFGVSRRDVRFQPDLGIRGAGVPDFAIGDILGEYDGEGHRAFGDRTEIDGRHDAVRRSAGYSVVRDDDPFVLAARLCVDAGFGGAREP